MALSADYLPRIARNSDSVGLAQELIDRHIDVFSTSLVLLPLNTLGHRSLLVLVNPGGILDPSPYDGSKSVPMMLLLDPKRDGSRVDLSSLCRRVRIWLNSLWTMRHDKNDNRPFTIDSFKLHYPEGNVMLQIMVLSLIPPCSTEIYLVASSASTE